MFSPGLKDMTSWFLPRLPDCEQSCHKQRRAGFCVDRRLQVLRASPTSATAESAVHPFGAVSTRPAVFPGAAACVSSSLAGTSRSSASSAAAGGVRVRASVIPSSGQWCLLAVLVCVSPMTRDVSVFSCALAKYTDNS